MPKCKRRSSAQISNCEEEKKYKPAQADQAQQHHPLTQLGPVKGLDGFIAKYKQGKKMGGGAFGLVYSGERKSDGLMIAIKHLPKKEVDFIFLAGQGELLQVPEEAYLMAKAAGGPDNLGQCAAVSLLDWFMLSTRIIIVMERPDPSMDLAHYSVNPLSEDTVRNIMRQLVLAVIDLHNKKVFHRDLKLDNILIQDTEDGIRVRIIDFGSGCIASAMPYTTFMGCPSSIPPELYLEHKYRAGPSSVWQIGAVAFNLLNGDRRKFDTNKWLLGKLSMETSTASKEGKHFVQNKVGGGKCTLADDFQPPFEARTTKTTTHFSSTQSKLLDFVSFKVLSNMPKCKRKSSAQISRGNEEGTSPKVKKSKSNKAQQRHLLTQLAPAGGLNDFNAKYELGNVLGCGAFGAIYSGVRKSDGLMIAIKYLQKEEVDFTFVAGQGELLQVPEEAYLMAKAAGGPDNLGQCAAVSLLDWFILSTRIIIVMERPDPSMDLAHYSVNPLSEDTVRNIMRQLVLAVIDLHNKKVFHRDLKLDNILIQDTEDGIRVRIIDFGSGCIATEMPYTIFMGSSGSIPPELYLEHKYRAGPTSVWQIGAVAFNLLNGDRRKFDTNKWLIGELSMKTSTASKEGKTFVQVCLEENHSQRISLEDLERHPWFSTMTQAN
ncbi:putative ribosomal protein S6 kinase alpha-2 [Eucyclogobius newberryi]|uniref:putative ribosomal protein S6 kinase alpha-2 n=1 Tax=Eucyclogobius newberryi TaxID=166745 RepID=UPI003B591E0E